MADISPSHILGFSHNPLYIIPFKPPELFLYLLQPPPLHPLSLSQYHRRPATSSFIRRPISSPPPPPSLSSTKTKKKKKQKEKRKILNFSPRHFIKQLVCVFFFIVVIKRGEGSYIKTRKKIETFLRSKKEKLKWHRFKYRRSHRM